MADIGPGNDNSTCNSNTKRPASAGLGPVVDYVRGGPDFFSTCQVRLIAGRLPNRAHGGDFLPPITDPAALNAVGPMQNAVLNAAAVRSLGFPNAEDAIGQPLLNNLSPGVFQPMTVVGVVQDIRFRSPVPPTIYLSCWGAFPVVVAGVRYSGDPRAEDRMGAQWRRIAPAVPFRARTSKDSLDRYYRPDDQHGRLFTFGALLAVLIGCVGLYGLASFSTARRTKEIGIRKTLGASTSDVLRLLVAQFTRPVLVANLIAWPLAWLAMRNWLAGFDQRIALGPQYFLAASFLARMIAGLTVVGQALRVARAEPAKALRHE